MSTKAERFLLERLAAGTTALLVILLALPARPAWADGVDAEGRSVVLIGAHQLGDMPDAKQAVGAVLESLAAGELPEGVHAIAYAPKASEALAEIVAGASSEVLVHGPRGTGKTQMSPGALAVLAELHARAGHGLPLRVLWLHDSLVNAASKTAPSLEAPMWGGVWTLREDRHLAVLTLGGVELVHGHFVGSQDATAAERLRMEAHVMLAEEVVASLDESGGIEERKAELAITGLRLPTRRRVAVMVTNPGGTDSWPFRRFLEGGHRPDRVACAVPATDRLTPAEVARLRDAFRDSPDLEKRLALGEWSSLQLGEKVAAGYEPTVHVAEGRLVPSPEHVLAIGWDGGHSPSAVIGQAIGPQVRIYASLNALKVGVLELIEDQVIPWLIEWAPWVRRGEGRALVHVIDPSMATAGQATIRESAERMIRETLRGRIVAGPVPWAPRREAILRVLAPRHEGGKVPLAISPSADTLLLRQAFEGRWYYPRTPDGRVDRSRPKKPCSPWADIGDAAAYLCGWLTPTAAREQPGRRPEVKSAFDVYSVGRSNPGPTTRRTA